jgi:hypothetical protein
VNKGGKSFHSSGVLQFLSSHFYLFHWRGLSRPLLRLIPTCIIFSATVNGIVFLISFSACYFYYIIEKLLIFIWCFHILLLSQKYFSDLRIFLVESLGSFKYRIISCANRDNLSFLLLLYLFFFLLPYCSG